MRALCQSDKPYDIIVASRLLPSAEKVVNSATTEFPSSKSKLHVLEVDIDYDDSIKKAFEEVRSKFGKVDAMVNNAGMLLIQHSLLLLLS